MSDTTQETVTTDAEVTTQEVKTDTVETTDSFTVDIADKDKMLEQLKSENAKYRDKLRNLKTELAQATEARTQLEAAKAEWERELAERKASERESLLETELDKASITEPKARELALRLLKDYEDVSEGIKAVTTEYPFLAGKSSVVLPDTGKATTKDTPVADKDKLAAGLAQLIKK